MKPPVLFCFDYLDPLSHLLDLELSALSAEPDLQEVRRVPLELRPPPSELLDPDDPTWSDRWHRAAAAGRSLGVSLRRPLFLPWTRKAHELVLHAAEGGFAGPVHSALFRAALIDGLDIGRVDVLVDIARDLGMDAQAAKAVLDVDRHAAAVAALGREAREAGATEPATLLGAGRALRGFHNRDALRTFLLR
jgi:predicted DsbA family dithiol-disulfide isomerase